MGAWRQVLAVTSCSIGFFVTGNLLGWASPVVTMIMDEGEPLVMTTSQISWMIGFLYFGNIISPIPGGYMMDYIGRKHTLLISSSLTFISWAFIYFAVNAGMLYVARFAAGMWSGVTHTVIPTYVAEISEPKSRGGLITLVMVLGAMGLFTILLIGPRVSYVEMVYIFGPAPLVFVCTFIFMPESPYFYVMKKRKRAAIRSLIWLRGDDKKKIKAELKQIIKTIEKEMKAGRGLGQLLAKENRRALVMVETLCSLQRLTGISALIAFSSITLPAEGVGSLDAHDCVAVMASVWVVSVIMAAVLIDNVGRKPLLVVSCIGTGLCMMTACVWYLLRDLDHEAVEGSAWVPFASFLVCGVTFSIGLGPIPSTIQGEVFASNVKAWASAVTAQVFSVASLVVNVIYLPIMEGIGAYLNFLIYTVACFGCLIFVIFVVKETKGKTLHEIHAELV